MKIVQLCFLFAFYRKRGTERVPHGSLISISLWPTDRQTDRQTLGTFPVHLEGGPGEPLVPIQTNDRQTDKQKTKEPCVEEPIDPGGKAGATYRDAGGVPAWVGSA